MKIFNGELLRNMKIFLSALLYALVIILIDWDYSIVNDYTKIHLLAVDLTIFGICFAIVKWIERAHKNADD